MAIPLQNIKSNILFMLCYYLKDLVEIDSAKTLSSPYPKLLSQITAHAVLVPCFRRTQSWGWLFLLLWGERGTLNPILEEFAYPSPAELIFIGRNCLYILQKVALKPVWLGQGRGREKNPNLWQLLVCFIAKPLMTLSAS